MTLQIRDSNSGASTNVTSLLGSEGDGLWVTATGVHSYNGSSIGWLSTVSYISLLIDGVMSSTAGVVRLGNTADVNTGYVLDVGSTAKVFAAAGGIAFEINGYATRIENEGYIAGGTALDLDGSSPTSDPTTSLVSNSGTIKGFTTAISKAGTDGLELRNIGTIEGGTYSFQSSAANAVDNISNAGLMRGKIELGGGADLYDGRSGRVIGLIDGGLGNDTIYGGAEANQINGGGDVDYLAGGGGNDTYIIARIVDGPINDTIVEAANAGNDNVMFYGLTPGDSYTLGANLENLFLSGNGTKGVGNALANTIFGDFLDNVINGGAGSDILTGFGGSDQFQFTTALGPRNVDRITDFSVPGDTIRLSKAIFTKIAGAAGSSIGASQFVKTASGVALDAQDRIIYETDTGKILYDFNGNVAGGAIHFATISTNLNLTAADFIIM